MNTIQSYISYLQPFATSTITGIATAISSVNNLNLLSSTYVADINNITNTLKSQLPTDLSDSDQTIADQVVYILNRISLFYPTVYNNYRQRRLESYPSIGDQLDMLWHAMSIGEIPKANTFYTSIQTVKNSYPKP
jgi:hypothetical protein